jgi:hypothetical protein
MTTTIVVLDGRNDPHASEVTAAIAEALAGEGANGGDGNGPGLSTVAPAIEAETIHDASTAVVLDDGSLVRAREAGVPFVVAVLPGFDLAWSGELRDADLVMVAHPSLVASVARRGVPVDRIAVCGPIGPTGFTPHADRASLRRDLQLDPEAPVVLVPSELLELEGPDALLVQLSLVDKAVQIMFDVGHDAEHADLLRERTRAHGMRAWMFAEEHGVSARWQCVDVVLGRVGGYEVPRALGVGAPLVLVPARRSAGAVADAMEAAGVAREADVLATLAVAIEAAVVPATLAEGRRAIADLSVGGSAARLATLVKEAAAQRAEQPRTPRGLPHGLERIGGERAQSAATRPESDLEDRIERELADLKKKLGA